MNIKKGLFVAGLGLLMAFGAAESASASVWSNNHPRRVEVNQRLRNQDLRIDHERRDGEISAWRARYLHAEDRGIRHEERFDARINNGTSPLPSSAP